MTAATEPIVVATPAGLVDVVGRSATGPWMTIDQSRIDQFADATDDHQWIHVEVDRAVQGPFGAPIAHGFLTLSLVTALTAGLVQVSGTAMGINYGLDKVRFVQPVAVGSQVRAVLTIQSAEPTGQGYRAKYNIVVEIADNPKPAAVVEWVVLLVPAGP